MKPAAMSRTWSANSRQVTGTQVPFTRRFRPTLPGEFCALATTSSVMLSSGFTMYEAGTENSCIWAPPLAIAWHLSSILTLAAAKAAGQGRRSRAGFDAE